MIPSENYDNLTPVHNQQYVAPANGWFSISNSNGDTSLKLVVNGETILQNWSGGYSASFLPVYKGATVICEFAGTPSWFRFVYARGATETVVCIRY